MSLYTSVRDKLKAMARGKRGLAGLSLAGFLESTFVPLPIELFLIPAFLANRKRSYKLATAALAGCFAGALCFYLIGWSLWEGYGQAIARLLGIEADLQDFGRALDQRGFWLVFSISFLPLPFQVATLGSGAFGFSLPLFCAAIISSRLLRFHGLALLCNVFGKPVQRFFERQPKWVGWLVFILSALLVGLLTLSLYHG